MRRRLCRRWAKGYAYPGFILLLPARAFPPCDNPKGCPKVALFYSWAHPLSSPNCDPVTDAGGRCVLGIGGRAEKFIIYQMTHEFRRLFALGFGDADSAQDRKEQ